MIDIEQIRPLLHSLSLHPIWRLLDQLGARWHEVAAALRVRTQTVANWRSGRKRTPLIVSLWLATAAEKKLCSLEAMLSTGALAELEQLSVKLKHARDLLKIVHDQNHLECTGRQAQEWAAYLASHQQSKETPEPLSEALEMTKSFRKRQARNKSIRRRAS